MSDSNTEPFDTNHGRILDIVINSLYTDSEIFVRELVSNASDSLEKLNHTQLTEKDVFDDNLSLEIHIDLDEDKKTFTITDYGIGMNREELKENLGTIANSGSKKFFESLDANKQKESSLIGQFGVGFYSSFMVAEKVEVFTHSWRPDEEHLEWQSDGKTGYTIEESEGQRRGCKIVLHLKEGCEEFAQTDRIKSILENYSAFVAFPILLNGERVNTVEAIWRKQKSEVKEEDYKEFYKFTSKAFDDPQYWMHFSSDSPIDLKSLLFVPTQNMEQFGYGQMEAGVSLYCKNVLIDDKPEGLLPEWARFLRGVIDSADLPLNISRESMQDSALVKKLNRVVIKRFLKFLDSEAKDDPEKYKVFYDNFSRFLKEGCVSDHDHKDNLAKLLRFESTMTDSGAVTSFEEYIDRAKEDQDKIYYLICKDRSNAEAGPYLEAFKARGLEVILLFDAMDEYLVQNLREFQGKELLSVSRANVDLDDSVDTEGDSLDEDQSESLCDYFKDELGQRVAKVATGKRLIDSPVAVLTPEFGMSPQMIAMMEAMNPDGEKPQLEVELEINPRHNLIQRLNEVRESKPELAKLVATQLFDNGMLVAGVLDDRKDMVARNIELMQAVLGGDDNAATEATSE